MVRLRFTLALLVLWLPWCAAGCGPPQAEMRHAQALSGAADPPRFVRSIAWAERGIWLKADTHVHTTFSDGRVQVEEVVRQAVGFGCDVVAITDHADQDLTAATPEYMQAIVAARARFPEIIILAGVEWNVPPWGGDEHATVLVPPGPDEGRILQMFKARFDDYQRQTHSAALADEGLRWLARQQGNEGARPLVIYNHPSRKRQTSMQLVAELEHLRTVSDILVGFSGAPGHQRAEALGAYKGQVPLSDRWDPAAARVGDSWDTLLQRGLDVWAARAPSDFHATSDDFWPGQFSETWVYAPNKTAVGVLQAFHAGSFFGAHGHIARQVQLQVQVAGLPRAAVAGEVIEVPAGTQLRVALHMRTPPTDWQGQSNRIEQVELIAVFAQGAQVLASRPPQADPEPLVEQMTVPDAGVVLRARGKRSVADGPDLMFYTNPVRVLVGS